MRLMKVSFALTGPLLTVALLAAGCLPEPMPAIDGATVLTDNTSLRIDASTSARTMFTLGAGERVEILRKQGTWYLVRDKDLIEGWMGEINLLRDTTRVAMEATLAASTSLPVQNTVRAREQVNLRLEPGRETAIIRRLRRGTTLEVLERATTPRPESDATDVWFKVRPEPDQIGWVYAQLIEWDTPEAISGFTEGRTYTAIHLLKEVDDPEVGPVSWYVAAERRDDTEPAYAFDGIRVFIWNLAKHQYETTLRLRNLRGRYPLELTGDAENPGFRFQVLDREGTLTVREFVMRGTLPREVR